MIIDCLFSFLSNEQNRNALLFEERKMSRELLKFLSASLFLTYLLNFCICTDHETSIFQSETNQNSQHLNGPKDYAFTSDVSRVKNLVNFFEDLNNSDNFNSNSETRRKQDLVISLPEAASKMYILSDGSLLDLKCNKYVKLIEQPNIRTFDMVNQLVNEKRLTVEANQDDANLIAKLLNERKFDAIGKIQTILQSLDSEKENLKSTYSLSVQKDLYDCISYYIYRYQRATTSLIEHVRKQQSDLCQVEQEDDLDINLRKLNEAVGRIESIESNQEFDVTAWLRELSILHDLIDENNLEIPVKIQKFVAQPDRLKRLESYNQVLGQANELKEKLSLLEGDKPVQTQTDNKEYIKILLELNELLNSHQVLLPVDIYNYIHELDRWQLIENELIKENEEENLIETIEEKSLEESCQDLANKLMESLRLFNWQLTSHEEAKSLSSNLNTFLDECYGVRNSIQMSNLVRQTRWPIISLTRKLSTWCLRMLKDLSLNAKLEENRQCLASVLEALDKIKAKDLKFDKLNS